MRFGLVDPAEGSLRLFGRTRHETGAAWLRAWVVSSECLPSTPTCPVGRTWRSWPGWTGPGRHDWMICWTWSGWLMQHGVVCPGTRWGCANGSGWLRRWLRRPRLLVVDEPTNGMGPADRVTVLDRKRVVFSGDLDQARAAAPDPTVRLSTNNDAASVLVGGRIGGLRISTDPRGGMRVTAPLDRVDRFVIARGTASTAVRRLTEDVTALEPLFFSLTDGAREGARVAARSLPQWRASDRVR